MSTHLTSKKRCDAKGRAFAGSQRQIQFYVNEQPSVLQKAISDAFNTNLELRWVSPLSSDQYIEKQDSAFLKALGLSKNCEDLKLFWPNGGPVWDALARVENGGVLLVEAKSHVPEMAGRGCKAVADSSIKKIEHAIVSTKQWVGAELWSDWKGRFYQSANRIAHLYLLREILGVDAWLVNLYFTDDPHSPTSRDAWETGIADVNKSLGIASVPFCASVFLTAKGWVNRNAGNQTINGTNGGDAS
jgi:hypothetical protein